MAGDDWRIVKRDTFMMRGLLQPCVIRGMQIIPLGPSHTTIEELRADLLRMLAACDLPVIEESVWKQLP